MSNIKVLGFKASDILAGMSRTFSNFSDAERQKQMKKINGVFELRITNADKEEAVWTIDMKQTGTISKGPSETKPGVTIILSDDVFADLASGKLNGQSAFMTGKLKTKGNIMLATKLDPLLKLQETKAKL